MKSCYSLIIQVCAIISTLFIPFKAFNAEDPIDRVKTDNTRILVGSEVSYPPYCFVNENGKADGFSVEVFKAAASAMNITFDIKTDLWENLKIDLAEGKIDALPLVGRTPEREPLFDFSFPYITMHGTIVVRNDETEIYSLSDLKGKKIAVMKGDNSEEFLHRIKLDATIAKTMTFEDALSELSGGVHDAVVMQKIVAFQLIKKLGITNLTTRGIMIEDFNQSFCFAVKKGNGNLLSLLNEGLSLVIADGTYRQLHAKWFGPLESIEQTRRRIIIGGDVSYPPQEFLDENNQPAGFNVDLMNAIAKHLDITIDIRLKPWNETINDLQEGRIDLIQGMLYSYDRDQKFSLSQAHTHISQVIMGRKGTEMPHNMAELKDKSIIVQRADLMHDLAVKMGYEDQLILTGTQEEALQMLVNGMYDCAIVSKLSALYWIKKHGWKNLLINETPVVSAEYCFAVLKGNDAILTQFSEGLAAVKASGEYRRINTKWFGLLENPRPGFREFLRYSLIFLIPLLILLFGSLIWSRTLHKRVSKRTTELQNEISIRKKTEAELNKKAHQYRELVENIWEGIGIVDTDEKFIFANPAAENIMGVEPGRLVGRNLKEFISKKELLKIQRQTIIRSEGLKSTYELEINSEGDKRILLVTATPQFDKKETYTGTFGIFRDITDRKNAEQALKKNEAKLKDLNATKDKFFSIIAHDLKNPLNTIVAFSELILNNFNKYEPQKISKFLEAIHQSSQQAYVLLENLLIWAHSQTGIIRFNPHNLSVNHLISDNINLLINQAIEKNISIVFSLKDDYMVSADKNMADTILRNLLTNAIKYTPSGGKIDVYTELYRQQVRIYIKDSGIGMSSKVRNSLFLIDKTVSIPGTANEKGTGLGLILCKDFVEKHGGKIWVESEPEKGSNFVFSLPLA